MNHFDIIIIGTGAGGGTLAHRLAPTAHMLERLGAKNIAAQSHNHILEKPVAPEMAIA